MSFEEWWSKNQELYTLAGVSKIAAESIWKEAQYQIQLPLSEEIDKLINIIKNE